MRILSVLPLAVVALTLGDACLSPVEGQSRPAEAGRPYARIGVGPGWSVLGRPLPPSPDSGPIANIAEEQRFLGLSVFMGLATEINRHVSIGLEANGWTGIPEPGSPTATRRTQLGLHGVSYLYPMAEGGFFVKGGLGLGVLVIDTLDGGGKDWGAGLGYLIGTGYDIPVGDETVLTPYLDVPFVRRFRDGVPNVIQMGLALGRR